MKRRLRRRRRVSNGRWWPAVSGHDPSGRAAGRGRPLRPGGARSRRATGTSEARSSAMIRLVGGPSPRSAPARRSYCGGKLMARHAHMPATGSLCTAARRRLPAHPHPAFTSTDRGVPGSSASISARSRRVDGGPASPCPRSARASTRRVGVDDRVPARTRRPRSCAVKSPTRRQQRGTGGNDAAVLLRDRRRGVRQSARCG